MPNPRKPSHLKSISGTDQPSRRPEAPPVDMPVLDVLPEAPSWLPNSHAVKEWQRLGPILVSNKLLTAGGVSAFGHLCALHGHLVQLWSAGMPPTGHILSQYRNLINDFGLTPVAQGKVKPVGDKEANGNPFGKFGRKGRQAAAAGDDAAA